MVRWHWLVPLAGGFALATLYGGLWLGGAIALGRTDAALAIPTLLGCAVIFGAWADSKTGAGPWSAALAGFGALTIVLAMTDVAGRWPLHFLASAALALGAALVAVRRSVGWHRAARWGGLAALALLWWLGSHVILARAYALGAAPLPGRTVMVTGLPLIRWPDPATTIGPREDVALSALRGLLARPLVLTDSLAAGVLGANDRLLLAHPQALSPAALVEVDRFVRAGGRAVLLADGLSGWPPPFGFGDRRNPPITSLLTPLLGHWGINLAAPVPDSAASGAVDVHHLGYRLTLHSAGQFDRLPDVCRAGGPLANGMPTIASCRIGRGTAILLADADLLYAPLWQSAPGWARHLRPADNVEWIADQLNDGGLRSIWGLHPTWRIEAAK